MTCRKRSGQAQDRASERTAARTPDSRVMHCPGTATPAPHHVLNFGRPLVDLGDARVAVEALRGHVADEAHAAQHLDRLVPAKGGGLGRAQLGH